MSKQILNRRDTAANWSTINPILGPGEIGVESDSGQFKLGDGTSTWSELDYFGAGGGGGGGGGSLITNPAKTYTVGAGGDFATFTELVEFFLENRNASNWEYSGNGRYRSTHTTIDLQGAVIDLGNETFAFDFFSGWLRFVNGGITNGSIYFTECWVRFSDTFVVDCSLQFNGGFAFDEYGYAEDRWTPNTSLTVTKGGTLIIEGGSPFNGGRITAFDNGMFIFDSEVSSFIESSDIQVDYGSWARIVGDVICGLTVSRSSELNVEGTLTIRGPKRGTIDQNSHVFVRDDFAVRSDGTSASLEGVFFKVLRNSGLHVSGTVDMPGGTGTDIPLDVLDSSRLVCDVFDVSPTGRTKLTVDRTSELHILDNESIFNNFDSIYHRPNLPTAYPAGQASAETQIWSDNGVMVIGATGVAAAVSGALGSETATADQVLSWDGSSYVWITPYGDADVDLHVNQSAAVTGQILSWNGTDYEWVSPSTGGGGYTDTDVDLHLNQALATEGQYLAWTGTDYGWVDSLDTRLKLSGAGEGQVLGWDGTDFVWTFTTENPADVLALVDFDVATVPEITDKSTYGNEILFYLSSGDLASRFPDALLTEYTPKFGIGSLAISFDPFGLPVSLGNGDFCVEFWLRRDQYTGNKPIWSTSDPGGSNIIMELYLKTSGSFPFGGELQVSHRRSDGSTVWGGVYGDSNVSYTQWTHVALYRRANVLYLGINGTINTITTGDRAEEDYSLSTEMAFGNRHPTHPNFSGNDRLGGGFDDIRVTVGSAVPYPAGAVGDTYDIPTEAHPIPGASSGGGNDSRITDTQIANWDTAFGWGDHSTAGYLTEFTESDPTVPQHVKDITEAQITAWDSGTGGGAVDSVNGQTGEVVLTASDVGAIDTETDPTVPQHVKDITQAEIDAWNAGGGGGNDSRITNQQITNWDEAHGWGDHAQAGYLTDFTESDPTVPTWVKSITEADIAAWNAGGGDDSRITNQQIIEWDTAFGWGDHAQAGYLTDFTETDPTVPVWVKNITQDDIDAWNADPAAQTIVEIGAEPVTPNQGDLWLNDANSTVYIYDAGNWLEFPIGEAGEVMSSQVQLGDGSTFFLEGTESLVTQADANKFIEGQLEALHNRIDTENNSLWEYTEAEQVIRPANDKNITSSSAVFGALQTGTLAASTAAFTTVTVAEAIQAEDFVDEDGVSLIERSNALDALLQAEIAALVKELQAASAEIAEIVAQYDAKFAELEDAVRTEEFLGESSGTLKWATGNWSSELTDATGNLFKVHTDFTRVVMNHDTISDGRKDWEQVLAPYPHTVGIKMSGVMYWMEVEFLGASGTNSRGKNFKILTHNLPTDAVANEIVEIFPDYKPAKEQPTPERIDGGTY